MIGDINKISGGNLAGDVADNTKVESLDVMMNQKTDIPMTPEEFAFKMLYNEWMQETLLSDGLRPEDKVEW
ncbi:hypothetical protein PL78_18235 [Yersinia entomophaga]|uniref:Uncharacterized protein n=1 Tax=Yersinia entomophaga TaxID=935293 RepID=A0ABN4Q3K6_YERET|nr:MULTISPECIES: hypothetical protein [Yersinia]ANI31747.1 hypothetical protein PL78_18235 [Yersinia entomophaga]OWF85408.1 hypothetical protein B4914_17395 [Yersinia entomophaga]